MEWIRVEDMLPGKNKEVWAYGRIPDEEKSYVWTAEFTEDGWYTPYDVHGDCEELIVSYWQPKRFPEPPEAGE